MEKKTKVAKVDWESTVEGTGSLSSYFVGDSSFTHDEAIIQGFTLADSFVKCLDSKKPIYISFTRSSSSKDIGSTIPFKDGYHVALDTVIFDRIEAPVYERLTPPEVFDIFCGVAVHETCHAIDSDFDDYHSVIKSAETHYGRKAIGSIYNIIEDERIELRCSREYPGLAHYLRKVKDHYLNREYVPARTMYSTDSDEYFLAKAFELFLFIVRDPDNITGDDFDDYGDFIKDIESILTPFPDLVSDVNKASKQVFELLKNLAERIEETHKKKEEDRKKEEEEKEKAGTSYSEESEESASEKIPSKSSLDESSEGGEEIDESSEDTPEEVSDKPVESEVPWVVEGLAGEESKEEPAKSKPTEFSVPDSYNKTNLDKLESTHERETKETDMSSDTKLIIKTDFAKEVEKGESPEVYFYKASDNKIQYDKDCKIVSPHASALGGTLKFTHVDQKLTLKSMRSGHLDVTKLAEAVQGVGTIYERYGDAKTAKVSIVLLIDQSGSMGGMQMDAARKAAILFDVSLKKVPDATVFIYGHTGDMTTARSTDIIIFKEPGFNPKYSLGNCDAKSQNRDGTAIREVVKRVRKFTKTPMVLFMISDGEPAAKGYGGEVGRSDVRQAVAFAERQNVQVISISIDSRYEPESMYKHYVKFTDLKDLPKQLAGLMKKVVTKLIRTTVTYR